MTTTTHIIVTFIRGDNEEYVSMFGKEQVMFFDWDPQQDFTWLLITVHQKWQFTSKERSVEFLDITDTWIELDSKSTPTQLGYPAGETMRITIRGRM